MTKITIKPIPGTQPLRAQAKPEGWLPRGEFDAFYAAGRAASWRYDDGSFLGPQAGIALLEDKLRAAGFRVSVCPTLRHLDHPKKRLVPYPNDLLRSPERQGLRLYPHQVEGVRWLRAHPRGLLADDPGVGKTPQALCAHPGAAPALIVCPAAMCRTWARETARWRPDLTPVLLTKFRWPAPAEVCVLSYNRLPATLETPPLDNTTLVLDEAHLVKCSKTLRAHRVRAVQKAVRKKDGRVWGLSGTPLPSKPIDLWNVLQNGLSMAEDTFGSFPSYCRMMGGTPGLWGGWEFDLRHIHPSIPKRLVTSMLRRTLPEVLPSLAQKALPAKRIYVPLSASLRKLADHAWNEILQSGRSLASVMEAVANNAPGFEEISAVRRALAETKVPALLEYLQGVDEPVLVFSAHRAPLELLEAKGWPLIIGGQTSAARDRIVQEFQQGDGQHLGVSIKAGGVGLTLTRASKAVFLDLAWTPGDNDQAFGRILRIGQQAEHVHRILLVSDHALEERVLEILEEKSQMIQEVLG